jgi:hypothetical protein
MVIMRKFWIALCFLCLILPAQAQTTWEAVFYVETGASPYTADLRVYRSDGQVTVLPLPSNLSQGANTEPRRTVLVSADRRFVVMSEYQSEPFASLPLMIADLQNATMRQADLPMAAVEAYAFAGFEPNGSRFAFSYVGNDPAGASLFVGGMAIADAASGAITANVLMRDAAIAAGLPEGGVWALMGSWEQDGIRFVDNCYACGGNFEGQYSLWLPDTGGFVGNPGIAFSLFGTRLDAMGEFLLLAQNQAFAFDPSGGMFLVPNVVHYTRAGEPVNFTTGQSLPNAPVAYFNLDAVSLGRVHWVADGAAFVVIPDYVDFWDVVFRAGPIERVPHGGVTNKTLLAGTPDGWLEQFTDARGNQVVVHHRMDNTQATIFSVPSNAVIQLVDAPQLGLSLPTTTPAFPLISGVSDTPVAATCPGFMASRLVVGAQGRVTPGQPNRVRENPNTASAVVGQIPGEGVFSVLEGPSCDPANGIAWWRVEYQGMMGWTAEGQGQSYWTEPLNR